MRAMRSLLCLILLLTACSTKASEGDCRKAIANVNKLVGSDSTNMDQDIEAAVRRCRAQWSKKAVQCAIDAKNADAIAKCEGAAPAAGEKK